MKDCCERDGGTSRVTVGTGSQRELVERFKGKFVREARMIASMSNRHIVRVIDVFEENGTAYYVMEDLPGGSLAERVRRDGPLPEADAERYIRQVADALSYIHGRDTVHLDVKPSNILLDGDGEAVLIDFGISKHYDASGEQTSSTPVGMSKGYAPLEQGRDGDVSQFRPSTDIYSLGATLYCLLTGEAPPEASVVNEDGLERPDGLSDRMWGVIERSMQPKRRDRPQSVGEFLALLDAGGVPGVKEEPKRQPGVNDAADDETVIAGGVAEKPQPQVSVTPPAPSRTHTPAPPTKEPTERRPSRRSLTWLWALFGVAAVVVVVVLSLPKGGGDDTYYDGSETSAGQISSPTGKVSGHGYVDLGLSVKWATCNVGASSPGEYGNYYAWGETDTKNDYGWDTYKWRRGSSSSLTKYNNDSSYGTVDNRIELEMSDDVARINWGDIWRMPTDAEWTELCDGCTWTWTTQGGHNGYRVTSKKNGNSIFLPAAGCRNGGGILGAGTGGVYGSSSLYADDPSCAWNFRFFSDRIYSGSYGGRFLGQSVRPVTE